MKPAPFVYIRPESTEELLDILGRVGPEAKLLAGGQSLIPMMNLRLVFPRELIDLNPLAELRYVRREEETVAIGAMTRQRALERSDRIVHDLPLLAEALPYIGHWQIRNRGTVGGSLAHADPAAELPAVALALDAEIVVRGPRGLRRIAADSFFTTYLTTTLAPDEVVTEVRVPIPSPGTGWAFREVARRYGDFALVLVAALVEVSNGRVARARLADRGVADRPASRYRGGGLAPPDIRRPRKCRVGRNGTRRRDRTIRRHSCLRGLPAPRRANAGGAGARGSDREGGIGMTSQVDVGSVAVTVNGERYSRVVATRRTLADFLRDDPS